MTVFYILLLAPMVLQHVVIGQDHIDLEKKNKFSLLIFFAFLAILVMLRHEAVGNDTRNYIYIYKRYGNLPWSEVASKTNEFGFAYFCKIVFLFSEKPQVFFAITVIATIAMMLPTYKRLCIDPALAIVLFCNMSTFTMLFSGIRQMLAIGIGFIAYEFTRNKKMIPFLLMVLLAMSFHTSAFMLAFMYPLYHAKVTKNWLLVVIPATLVIFVYNRPIFTFLAAVLESFTEYDGSITTTGAYTLLILFGIFTVFTFAVPDESQMDVESIGLRNFLLLALVIQMFAPLHTLAMRMNYYYIIFIPLLIPKVIQCRSERWSQMAILGRHIMVVFFFLYFFFTASAEGSLHVFPYHFFWESIG